MTCGMRTPDVHLFNFYLSHGLIRVCEIELSRMGQNNGNPDLVCKILLSLGLGIRFIEQIAHKRRKIEQSLNNIPLFVILLPLRLVY